MSHEEFEEKVKELLKKAEKELDKDDYYELIDSLNTYIYSELEELDDAREDDEEEDDEEEDDEEEDDEIEEEDDEN